MNFTPFAYFEKTPQVAFIGTSFSNSSQASYTFTNVNFGSSGLCAITIGSEINGAAGRTITSVTLGGVTMSKAVEQTSALNSTGVASAIFYLRKSNTTGNVIVNFSVAPSRCLIAVYSISDNSSDIPYQTKASTATTGTGLSNAFTSLYQDSAGILQYTIGLHSISPTTITWTNATLRFNLGDGVYGNSRYSGADFLTTSAGNRTVTTSHTNSTQPISLVGAVWK